MELYDSGAAGIRSTVWTASVPCYGDEVSTATK
jgi:hypothetical protein